ncbi:MAG TPA: DmsE family decaheme c-type cytochrome [Thermoanaerobaculia bacterium]|nr:DmsE family decaheme c-type cytochrome [Thermoanaerobaculia bacterium]
MTAKATGRLALLLILALVPPWAAAVAQETAGAEPIMSCGDCHEQAAAFVFNPHARGSVKEGVVANATCESCHGDGTEHMESGGETDKITIPIGRAGADATCLTCHDKTTARRSHRSGVHANSAAVNCLSCHSIHHAEEPRALLVKSELALCATCHSTQTASFRGKPFAHRLGHAGMGCTSCHEPHGRAGRQSLRITASGEIACASCHREKHGPFVFEHGALAAGDCMSCHEPHGSANPRQLKRATVAQLCLECHSPTMVTTAGSQPPSFHNISSPRFQNCTTCHVAVHGSNRSPQLLK